MDKKILGFLFSLVATAILITILLTSFYYSPQFEIFLAWTQNNKTLFFLTLILLKILGVVYPPLPGSIFTLSSIPIIGWQKAYLAEFAGSLIGASISFLLAKKYGHSLVQKIFGAAGMEKIQTVKIKKEKELEALIFLRIVGGNIIEVINYSAGLINISYFNFLLAAIIAHPIIGLPIFFSAGKILAGNNLFLYTAFVSFGLFILYRLRGRYFE